MTEQAKDIETEIRSHFESLLKSRDAIVALLLPRDYTPARSAESNARTKATAVRKKKQFDRMRSALIYIADTFADAKHSFSVEGRAHRIAMQALYPNGKRVDHQSAGQSSAVVSEADGHHG
jgi:hypothetical protein